ncbi:hypothetical protein NVIRENTERO_01332 [Sodalis praecaptivus]|nr:hypothetical protein NVIRENTERO_01332 [Sodalis praecaptivus]
MDHAIYTAMGAAAASLDQQAVIANNLANASTTGFRAQLSAARAVPVEGVAADPHPERGLDAGRADDARAD